MSRFVIVRCGGNGTQLARMHAEKPGKVLLEKWRAQGRKWTLPRWYPIAVVIGDAPPNDPRRKRALLCGRV